MTNEDKKRLKLFEKRLGYSFRDRGLLKQSLTHKSCTNENNLPALQNNERNEYLGDAVLELAISHLLFENFGEHPEGELSKLRAAVVNEAELADIARKLDLGEYLYLGRGEEQTGGRDKSSILSDAYEAVLGGVYLDRGFKKVFPLVEKHFAGIVGKVGNEGFVKDYKTRLQEKVQSRFHVTPSYKIVRSHGPDHSKTFEVNVVVKEIVYGVGRGSSKKVAEQSAAQEALIRLEGDSGSR